MEILAAVRERVEAVLAEPLYWFPLRHHSPTVARHLRQVILTRRPRLLLLEAPTHLQPLLPWLLHGDTRPPVALYSCWRDDDNRLGLAGELTPSPELAPRFASFYPLLNYSPEYIALQTAAQVGATVELIDLPPHALLTPQGPTTESWPTAEGLLTGSDFYQQLAEAGGYRHWEEAWETLFEGGDDDPEAYRRRLATFCAAARATVDPARLAEDGTLARERQMSQAIGRALEREGLEPRQALVVTGGFHLFLDRQDHRPPPQPLPGTVQTSIVPYSWLRLSKLGGYGAGNPAPRYFQSLWQPRRNPADDYVLRTLRLARQQGEGLSTADALATVHHATLLAGLRGRSRPVLDDLQEALLTCCCKGNPRQVGERLQRAMIQAAVGNRVGQVTPELGRLPLVDDFHRCLEILELDLQRDRLQSFRLDLRQPPDESRSIFFQRLAFLEIPRVSQDRVAMGLMFREHWQLGWSPDQEPRLIELAVYGDTLETVAQVLLEERLLTELNRADAVCRRLEQALRLDLTGVVGKLAGLCHRALEAEARFLGLCQGLAVLVDLGRYLQLRNLPRDWLPELIQLAWTRACLLLPEMAAAPSEEEEDLVQGLRLLGELLLGRHPSALERDLLIRGLELARLRSTVPFLRGALLGMEVELKVQPPEVLAREVTALVGASPQRMIAAGELIDGIMAVARTAVLLGFDDLVTALDQLLGQAPQDSFLTMLPRLRGAFERLPPRERQRLAQRVARRYGLAEDDTLTLAVSPRAALEFAELDRQMGEILQAWSL